MEEAFFAYRLPDDNQVFYLKGELQLTQDPDQLNDKGIMIRSFSGDQFFFLKNCLTIDPNQFKTFLHPAKDEFICSKEEYLDNFEKMMVLLTSGQFQKLVLSRISEQKTSRSAMQIFDDLNKRYKNTFNYIFSSNRSGTWLGASPELLLMDDGHEVSTVSLAGTKPSDGFSEWTKKEKQEQKIVTEYIVDCFQKNNFQDIRVSSVYTVKAGPVEHLKTDICAKSETPESLFTLLNDLHPTPATCGIPKIMAAKKIAEIEKHNRKLYTGYIGIISENRKTFFVNLRCLELQINRALLYLGGGITSSSVGINEWVETERKSETLIPLLS